MYKKTILSIFVLTLVAGISFFAIYQPSMAQEYSDDTRFTQEMTVRRNLVIDVAETWASEELGLSLEEVEFEANISFSNATELWRVDLKDTDDNVFASANVNPATRELNEIITVAPSTVFVEVDGMNIILVDYTWADSSWYRNELESRGYYIDSDYFSDYLDLEESGAIIARAVYEEFGVNVDGSRFDMHILHKSFNAPVEQPTWWANIFLDSERVAVNVPYIVPDFGVTLDALTGEIHHIFAHDVSDDPHSR